MTHIKTMEEEIDRIATEIEDYRKNNDVENDSVASEHDEYLVGLVSRLSSLVNIMSNDYQKNVELRRKITGDLNARRRDRSDQLKNIGSTFLGLVNAFNDKKVREIQGRHMEMLKLAGEKKMGEWRQPMRFADGAMDCILLDDESVISERTNNIIQEKLVPDLLNNPQEEDKQDA